MQNSSLIDLVMFRRFFLVLPCSKALISGDLLGLFREKESKDSEVSFAEPESAGYSCHILAI